MPKITLETNPSKYVQCEPHTLYQDKPRYVPRALYVVIGWITDLAFNLDMLACRLFKSRHFSQEFEDNSSTKLALFIHGLRGQRAIWYRTVQAFKKEFGTDVSYYTPTLHKKGNCSGKEAAEPIIQRILEWVEADPLRETGQLYISGVSRGGLVATLVTRVIQVSYPNLKISVSCLATPLNGSRLIANPETPAWLQRIWRWLLQSPLLGALHPAVYDEMVYDCPHAHVIQDLLASAQVRCYDIELYTTWGDFMVSPDAALFQTRPQLPCTRFKYRGHNGIVAAARTREVQTAKRLFTRR